MTILTVNAIAESCILQQCRWFVGVMITQCSVFAETLQEKWQQRQWLQFIAN